MKLRMHTAAMFLMIVGIGTVGCNSTNSPPKSQTEGGEKSGSTKVLEAGAKTQSTTPVNQINIYLVGFHPMKDSPSTQMEAHHYCRQVNEDFAQCVLFDGNTSDAKMNGIEYIISESTYSTLPEDEKQYWHPHNYEILSGQLVAPGLPDSAEHALMSKKMNSYGKTWHLWKTDSHDQPGDQLPLGPPQLAWSFNRDGEMDPAMLSDRDRRMNIDSGKKREGRQDLAQSANPQGGVNQLRDAFPAATGAPAGVKDLQD